MTKKNGTLLELKLLSDQLKNPNLTLLQQASLKIRYDYIADDLRERARVQD